MSQLRVTTLNNASNTGTENITLDDAGNATVGNTLVMGSSFKRNKIINGDMRVDQRNAGASITANNSSPYTLDRWSAYCNTATKFTVQQNAGSVTPPVGYTNYLGCTSTSAYTLGSGDQMLVTQRVEGLNTADLAWGTANAKTITISFWVYSSLTGTFGGSLQNSAQNWCYPFSYTISQASVWEQKTITITGPNASQGTWLTNNGIGIILNFSIGTGTTYSGTAGSWVNTSYITSVTGAVSVVGTNGATFYITGVQLEVGSVATPYERQIYSDQLAQCQRYLPVFSNAGNTSAAAAYVGQAYTTTQAAIPLTNPVPTRVPATGIVFSGTATLYTASSGATTNVTIVYNSATINATQVVASGNAVLVAGNATHLNFAAGAYIYGTGCEL